MLVKREDVANNYTKYIHFIYPLDTMDGNMIRKMHRNAVQASWAILYSSSVISVPGRSLKNISLGGRCGSSNFKRFLMNSYE